jgi:hypothetical protein
MSDQNNETVVETSAADISLSLTDIQNALQVIDYACDQGAFKGWKTIEQVLGVRQRLNAFLEAAAAAAPVAEAEVTETTETVEG